MYVVAQSLLSVTVSDIQTDLGVTNTSIHLPIRYEPSPSTSTSSEKGSCVTTIPQPSRPFFHSFLSPFSDVHESTPFTLYLHLFFF